MGFNDRYRLSAHAVITNVTNDILLLKANYGEFWWRLPGGAFERGETSHETVIRECREELGIDITISALTGVCYHSLYESYVFIFRCVFSHQAAQIILSSEHSKYKFCEVSELSSIQQIRIRDALNFDGTVKSQSF